MGKAIHVDSTISYLEQKNRGRTIHFRRSVFNLLKAASQPMTDRELMAALNELDVNNVRPEVTRLKQDNLIREVDKVSCQFTGKRVRRTEPTGRPYFDRGHEPDSPPWCVTEDGDPVLFL